MNHYFETHCHLDSLKTQTIEESLKQAKEKLVDKIVTIAVETKHLDEIVYYSNLYNKDFGLYCTQGIHPHSAKEFNSDVLDIIKNNAINNKSVVVAIGEIGLDYHYNFSPKEEQQSCFESQLQLASELDMPVVIHTREADDDTLAILKNFKDTLKFKGVLHSYTSGIELAKWAIDQGFYLGFNGIITFKNAQNVRDVLQMVPSDQIVVETDAPYLTPIPFRGKENAPMYIPYVYEHIYHLRKITVEKLYQNAQQLFRFTV